MDAYQSFNRVLDLATDTLSSINPGDLYDSLKLRPGHRPSFRVHPIKEFEHLISYGPQCRTLIEPASSDEESESEGSYPSARKVIRSILDSNMTSITVSST